MIRKVVVVSLVVVVVGGAAGGYAAFRRPTPGEVVQVVVEQGQSTVAIAELLQREGVISSVLGFRVMTRLRGLDGTLRAGRYELYRGMGVHAALDRLAAGAEEERTFFTIPEGYSVGQVAARVGEHTHISEEAFLEVAENGTVRGLFQPDGIDNLEGFLYPDTYAVVERDTAETLLRRMVAEFEKRVDDLDWSVPESRGLSRYDALIIASLIEREAKVDEDREKISAVVYNRLEIGMRLQIDITALYDRDHTVPTRRDLERESPYNTYLIDGLPPTPIANPGLPAIQAALNPADIDAIYYVVIDPSGRHGFTRSHDEFLRLRELRPPEVRGG